MRITKEQRSLSRSAYNDIIRRKEQRVLNMENIDNRSETWSYTDRVSGETSGYLPDSFEIAGVTDYISFSPIKLTFNKVLNNR